MSRFDFVLAIAVVAVVTFVTTEWIHYRLGNPPVFEVLLGPAGAGDPNATGKLHDSENVTESEFQTYLHVLEAMQSDRSLSIEDAVASEHINLDAFRTLEQRVQRNDGLIDRARHILRDKAESLWNSRGAPLEHG
jgi:hypothetical protein